MASWLRGESPWSAVRITTLEFETRIVRLREPSTGFDGVAVHEQPVGEHLKYLVWAQQRPVAALAWSSSPRHLGARDRYLGWSQPARQRNLHLIAYNTRSLILPWVRGSVCAGIVVGIRLETTVTKKSRR